MTIDPKTPETEQSPVNPADGKWTREEMEEAEPLPLPELDEEE